MKPSFEGFFDAQMKPINEDIGNYSDQPLMPIRLLIKTVPIVQAMHQKNQPLRRTVILLMLTLKGLKLLVMLKAEFQLKLLKK